MLSSIVFTEHTKLQLTSVQTVHVGTTHDSHCQARTSNKHWLTLTPFHLSGFCSEIMRGGKKGQNFLYFCMLTPFSIEKRWLKWLGGGKCRPVPTSYMVSRCNCPFLGYHIVSRCSFSFLTSTVAWPLLRPTLVLVLMEALKSRDPPPLSRLPALLILFHVYNRDFTYLDTFVPTCSNLSDNWHSLTVYKFIIYYSVIM